jgi:hypothetical protein
MHTNLDGKDNFDTEILSLNMLDSVHQDDPVIRCRIGRMVRI